MNFTNCETRLESATASPKHGRTHVVADDLTAVGQHIHEFGYAERVGKDHFLDGLALVDEKHCDESHRRPAHVEVIFLAQQHTCTLFLAQDQSTHSIFIAKGQHTHLKYYVYFTTSHSVTVRNICLSRSQPPTYKTINVFVEPTTFRDRVV